MGCGASARSAPPKDDGTIAEPELGTWATKTTSSPSAKDAFGTEVETFTSPKGGALASNKQAQAAIIVLDAEEDEDGIEVIYETAPKVRPQPAAANGQEPPEALEEPRRPEPKPMSKQQAEEAAKLAETRKRFEERQRYQKQRTTGSSPEPFDMPGFINTGSEIPHRPAEAVSSTKGYPGPQNVAPAREARKPSLPKTDMMLGLNVSAAGPKDMGDPFGCLPGGIFDELEDLQQPPPDAKIRQNQHDDAKSNGFDQDDEMLMKEILENFDA